MLKYLSVAVFTAGLSLGVAEASTDTKVNVRGTAKKLVEADAAARGPTAGEKAVQQHREAKKAAAAKPDTKALEQELKTHMEAVGTTGRTFAAAAQKAEKEVKPHRDTHLKAIETAEGTAKKLQAADPKSAAAGKALTELAEAKAKAEAPKGH